MRAIQVTRLEGPDALELVEVPEPVAGPNDVLIDIEAAGVSFPDLLLSRGLYQLRPDPPFIPGVEAAGVVAAAPADSGFAVGDRVMAFTNLGAFAERVALARQAVFPVPAGLSTLAAGGFVMNYHTAHFALHRRAHLQAGDTVLVHGAAGGLGTALIQVAKGAGARVIGVASSPEKAQVARDAGADDVVATDGFKDAVLAATDGRGVEVVADVVGGPVFDDSIRVLALEGRLLVLGFAGGAIPEVKTNRLLLRNVAVVGAGWGAFLAQRPDTIPETATALHRLVDDGHINPVVGPTYPLEHAGAALRELESRTATGKVTLQIR